MLAWLLLGCVSCSTTASSGLKVPAPGQDHAPTMRLSTVLKQGLDWKTVTQSGSLNLPMSTRYKPYLVTAAATNPAGGVKEMRLDIGQGGRVLQTITNAQTPNSNGYVNPDLAISGTDGHGGVGAQAIEVEAGINPWMEATVTATNFNGQTASMQIYFNVEPDPPTIRSFSAAPNNGYINAGTPAILSWDADCGIGSTLCNVALRGADDAPGYKHQVLFVPALTLSGKIQVRPTQGFTRYTLTVTNLTGGAKTEKSLEVQLYNAPNVSGKVFYFKMTGSSTVTRCFTLAIYAPDAATAKQLAEVQNGGFTATEIDEQQFLQGC